MNISTITTTALVLNAKNCMVAVTEVVTVMALMITHMAGTVTATTISLHFARRAKGR